MQIYDVVYTNPDCNGGGLSKARSCNNWFGYAIKLLKIMMDAYRVP